MKSCLAFPKNARILCIKYFFLYMNSVSRLCLRLRDTTLDINLPFDMCRWLVEGEGEGEGEGEDVEGVHEVLVRHHRLLTSRPLLRP